MISVGLPVLKVLSVSDNRNLLIFVFADLTTANRYYEELKDNVVMAIIAINDERIAVQFGFRDISVIWPDYVFSKDAFLEKNLQLFTHQPNHEWTCGYYEDGEENYLKPLKPLVVALW